MLKINFDALGIAASIACAIHCAMLPLVLSSLPILGVNIINNLWFELGMIFLALAIGIYSLTHGFRRHHHRILPIVLFVAGIGFLFVKQVFHNNQLLFLIPGVALVVSAHFINYRQCRKEGECSSDGCKH